MNRTLLLALLVAPSLALAQRTYIEVGSPNFQPLPIAVPAFDAEPGATAEATEVTQVVRNDLIISGLFDVLDQKSFTADSGEGRTVASIRFTRWADVGAEALVKAIVKRDGAERACELRLFEVRAGREVMTQTRRAGADSLRWLGHQLADDIIRYYTHERGLFETRILALRRTPSGGREIVAYGADGQDPEVLYRDNGLVLLPSWRPDGKAVLFTAYRNSRPELFTLDVATKRARPLVSIGDLTTGGTYSPDGRHIAFTASQGGNSDVWVANADGSGPRRLTTDPANDTSPTWSPDGRRICFISNRSGNPHLYVMNADGSGQKRLTFQGNYNQEPKWSPRGDLIAFTGRDERRVFDIFTVNPDTGKIQRVTQDAGRSNWEPTWSPNGRMMAFTTDRNGRPQIVVALANGDRQAIVTRDPLEISTPAWSPFP